MTVIGAGCTYLESFGTGPEDNYVIRSDYAPGLMVLQDLGPVPSTTTRWITEECFMISQERLGDYDADVIFIGLPEETEFDALNIELVKETFAAEHDQIFFVSRDIWGVELVEALFGVAQSSEPTEES